MATDIGTLALKITADPTSFESGLTAALGQADRFGAGVVAMGQYVAQVFGGIAAHPWGAAFAGATAAFGAFVAAGALLRQLKNEGTEAALAQQKLSIRFGLSSEAAGGFTLMTRRLGIDTAEAGQSIFHLQRHLEEAAHSGGKAQAALQALGLDARILARMKTEDAMFVIGDALKAVADAGQRNALAYQLLGRHGMELLPIILKGTKEFERAEMQAKKWGLTLSANDKAIIKSAAVAEKEASMIGGILREAVAQQVAVGWAKAFRDMLPLMDKYGQELGIAVGQLGLAFGLSGDWKDVVQFLAEVVFKTILLEVVSIVRWLSDAVKLTGELATRVQRMSLYQGVRKIGQAAGIFESNQAADARRIAEQAKAAAMPGILERQRAAEALRRQQDAGLLAFAEENAKLADQLELVKLTADQAARLKLIRDGMNVQQVEITRFHQQQLEAATRLAALESPYEKWVKDTEQINTWLQRGAINADEQARLLGAGAEALVAAQKPQGTQLASGLSRGSSEAVSAINQAMSSNPQMDIQQQIKQELQKAEQTRQQQMQDGRRVREAIEQGKVFKVANI